MLGDSHHAVSIIPMLLCDIITGCNSVEMHLVAAKETSDMQTSRTMLLHFQDFFGVLKDQGRFPGLFRPGNYKHKIPGYVGTLL